MDTLDKKAEKADELDHGGKFLKNVNRGVREMSHPC